MEDIKFTTRDDVIYENKKYRAYITSIRLILYKLRGLLRKKEDIVTHHLLEIKKLEYSEKNIWKIGEAKLSVQNSTRMDLYGRISELKPMLHTIEYLRNKELANMDHGFLEYFEDSTTENSVKEKTSDVYEQKQKNISNRFPYVLFPKQIYCEEIAPLEITIKVIRSTESLAIGAIDKPEIMELFLAVYAIIDNGTFEIIDPQNSEISSTFYNTILVPIKEKDSDPVVFLLKAKKEGLQNIYVRFYQNGTYLGKLVISTNVLPQINRYITKGVGS